MGRLALKGKFLASFHRLSLTILDDAFVVCRLGADAPILPWAIAGSFFPITRTADELSVFCRQDAVPEGVLGERGWRCLRADGTIPLLVVGVLASLAAPLAEAGIRVFAVSTFDTDNLLVMAADFERAVAGLTQAGRRTTVAPQSTPASPG
jgi:hypothetical protein